MSRAYRFENCSHTYYFRSQRLRPLGAFLARFFFLLTLVTSSGRSLAHPPPAVPETLTVGWFERGSGFLDYEDQQGVHQGLDPDILHRLALTHGLTLSYKTFESIPAALEALDEGRIDVVPAMFGDGVNAQHYWLSPTYSRQQIGIVKRSALPEPQTLSDLAGYRIAAEQDGVSERLIEKQLPNVHFIAVQSPQEGVTAVSQGAADVYVGLQSVNRTAIAQLGVGTVQSVEIPNAQVDLHFVTRQNDRHSIAVIENGLMRLSDAQRADIQTRWLNGLPELPGGKLAPPTPPETAWLRQHPVVKIGIYSFREPYDFLDENNQLHGVGATLLTAFAVRYSLRIEPVLLSAFGHPFDALDSGRVDVIASAPISNIVEGTARVTRGYDSLPWLLISRMDRHPAQARVGAQLWRLPYLSPPPHFSSNQLVAYDTSDDATDALLKGEIDAAFVNSIAANRLGTALKSGAIAVDRRFSSTEEIGYAVVSDNAPLQALLNQFVGAYPPDQLSEIIRRNHPANITIGFDPKAALRIAAPIGLVIAVLFAILGWANLKIRRAGKIATRARIEADAARQQAEIADQAKSTFLATMSHEIRTPMNGIVGVIDVLQTTPLSEFQKRYLDAAQQSTRLLLRVINDILDFSKMEAGRLVIDPTPVDLYQAAEGIAGLYQNLAQQKNIGFYFAIMPHFDRYVLVDEVRLTQIITNLVSNSIRFTESGYVCVRIRNVIGRAGPILHIQVSDTGTGMSNAYLDRLFEPFMQEDGSTTRRYGGTGLGLSIVKRLIDLMHGTVQVQSTLGRGTRIDIRLPFSWGGVGPGLPRYRGKRVGIALRHSFLAPSIIAWLRRMDVSDAIEAIATDCVVTDDTSGVLTLRRDGGPDLPLLSFAALPGALHQIVDAASPASTTASAAETILSAPDKRMRPKRSVMIVEDNDINRDILKQQLRLLNIDADTAGDGEEALASWKTLPFTAMLVDCQMPRMDGYELTRRIRSIEGQEQRPRTLIIAITANAGIEDERRCLDAGMDDFLPKPLTRKALEAMLLKWQVPIESIVPSQAE